MIRPSVFLLIYQRLLIPDHQILFSDHQKLKISNLNFFKNYLINRKHHIQLNNVSKTHGFDSNTTSIFDICKWSCLLFKAISSYYVCNRHEYFLSLKWKLQSINELFISNNLSLNVEKFWLFYRPCMTDDQRWPIIQITNIIYQ